MPTRLKPVAAERYAATILWDTSCSISPSGWHATLRRRAWQPAAGAIDTTVSAAVPLLLGIAVSVLNLGTGILPQHTAASMDNRGFHQSLLAWQSHSQPNDVLITAGDLVPDLLYWSNRPNTVNLYRSLQTGLAAGDTFGKLRSSIDEAVCANDKVFFAPAASQYISDGSLSVVDISRSDLRRFFDSYVQVSTTAFWYTNTTDDKPLPVYQIDAVGIGCGRLAFRASSLGNRDRSPSRNAGPTGSAALPGRR